MTVEVYGSVDDKLAKAPLMNKAAAALAMMLNAYSNPKAGKVWNWTPGRVRCLTQEIGLIVDDKGEALGLGAGILRSMSDDPHNREFCCTGILVGRDLVPLRTFVKLLAPQGGIETMAAENAALRDRAAALEDHLTTRIAAYAEELSAAREATQEAEERAALYKTKLALCREQLAKAMENVKQHETGDFDGQKPSLDS